VTQDHDALRHFADTAYAAGVVTCSPDAFGLVQRVLVAFASDALTSRTRIEIDPRLARGTVHVLGERFDLSGGGGR
jgi:hypothetical protein